MGAFGGPSLMDLPMPKMSLGAGWPRSLHFLAAWVIVLTGAAYVSAGVHHWTLPPHLLPAAITQSSPYNTRQRLAYLSIVFGVVSRDRLDWARHVSGSHVRFPFLATLVGGQQSARTIHFVASGGLLLFVVGHFVMVWRSGFRRRVSAMSVDLADSGDGRDLVELPARRRLILAGIYVAATGVPLGIARLKRAGFVPPDATGILGVGEAMTYATHRAFMSTGSMAREFRRRGISAVTPINGSPPKRRPISGCLPATSPSDELSYDIRQSCCPATSIRGPHIAPKDTVFLRSVC